MPVLAPLHFLCHVQPYPFTPYLRFEIVEVLNSVLE